MPRAPSTRQARKPAAPTRRSWPIPEIRQRLRRGRVDVAEVASVEEARLAQVGQRREGDGHDRHGDQDPDEPTEGRARGDGEDDHQRVQRDEPALDHRLEQVALHLLHHDHHDEHGEGPPGAAVGEGEQHREQPGDHRADEGHEGQDEGEQADRQGAGHAEDRRPGPDEDRVDRGDGRRAVHVALELLPGVAPRAVGEGLGAFVEESQEPTPHHVSVPQDVEEGEEHEEGSRHRLERHRRHPHRPPHTGVLQAGRGVLEALTGVGHGVLAEAVRGDLLQVVDPFFDPVGDHVGLVGDGIGAQRAQGGERQEQEDQAHPGGQALGHPVGPEPEDHGTQVGRQQHGEEDGQDDRPEHDQHRDPGGDGGGHHEEPPAPARADHQPSGHLVLTPALHRHRANLPLGDHSHSMVPGGFDVMS